LPQKDSGQIQLESRRRRKIQSKSDWNHAAAERFRANPIGITPPQNAAKQSKLELRRRKLKNTSENLKTLPALRLITKQVLSSPYSHHRRAGFLFFD